jgi:hypothetical protein
MIIAASLLSILLTPTADADTIVIQKNGPFMVYAWVDGQPKGKIKGKKMLHLEVPAGEHEVWIAAEETGTVTTCHGMITVQGSALVAARGQSCDGLSDGYPAEGSLFAGSLLALDMSAGSVAWISVDGGPGLVLPAIPLELNLTPGAHSLVLYGDEELSAVLAEGAVDLSAGQRAAVVCSAAGCEGWDAAATAIEGLTPAPQAAP